MTFSLSYALLALVTWGIAMLPAHPSPHITFIHTVLYLEAALFAVTSIRWSIDDPPDLYLWRIFS